MSQYANNIFFCFFADDRQFQYHQPASSSLQIDDKQQHQRVPDMEYKDEAPIVPPPNFNKARMSMKTVDGIRAEKLQKKQKRQRYILLT